jgi:hypothetical protein
VLSVGCFDEAGVVVRTDHCHEAEALGRERRGERPVLRAIGCADDHEARSLRLGSQLPRYVATRHADDEVGFETCGEQPPGDSRRNGLLCVGQLEAWVCPEAGVGAVHDVDDMHRV